MEYRTFNTGDQVWVSNRFGKEVAVKVHTNDGICWSEGDRPNFIVKLTGLEAIFHKIEVCFIKLMFKTFS